MTNARAIEMFIKPNFKYFLMPFGYTCVHSTYTFNSISKAKAFAEKLWLEKKKRCDIFNVYYRDKESDFGGGWRSNKILRLDENDGSWDSDWSDYDLHTAFFFSYDEYTISQWDNSTWKKLQTLEIECSNFDELTEEEVRTLLMRKRSKRK